MKRRQCWYSNRFTPCKTQAAFCDKAKHLFIAALCHKSTGSPARQLWLFQMKIGLGRETKSQGAVKMLSLRLFSFFFLYLFCFFVLSPPPPTPSSSPLLSRDNRGTLQSDRWQCHGKRRGERDRGWRKNPGLQNFPKYSQHIGAYFVYCIKQAHLCISHIKVAVISPPSCSFVIQGSLCYTALMLCWGKGW